LYKDYMKFKYGGVYDGTHRWCKGSFKN
jgi:hypothetical protein